MRVVLGTDFVGEGGQVPEEMSFAGVAERRDSETGDDD